MIKEVKDGKGTLFLSVADFVPLHVAKVLNIGYPGSYPFDFFHIGYQISGDISGIWDHTGCPYQIFYI